MASTCHDETRAEAGPAKDAPLAAPEEADAGLVLGKTASVVTLVVVERVGRELSIVVVVDLLGEERGVEREGAALALDAAEVQGDDRVCSRQETKISMRGSGGYASGRQRGSRLTLDEREQSQSPDDGGDDADGVFG